MYDKNTYFIALARTVALKSKDPSTQIGTVIVSEDNSIVSTGYNSFPRGYPDDEILSGEFTDRLERPEKYYWFEHSERNAVYNAARHGIRLNGCRMYTNAGIPCVDCTRAIIQAGIIEIHYQVDIEMRNRWKTHAPRSAELLDKCGVKRFEYVVENARIVYK